MPKQVQCDQAKQPVIQAAETQLLGAAEKLLTDFTNSNKDYAKIPEAERLINNIQALIDTLPAFLNTVNTRIYFKNLGVFYTISAANSLEPMLTQLAIVRQILGNLAPLANDMRNLTAQQEQVVVNLRKQINAFILSLLKDGSVIKQIIAKMNINIPLLLRIGQGGKLVGTGLDNATQSEHVGVFFDCMLTELLCEIPTGYPDEGQNAKIQKYKKEIAGKKLDKMDLPARQVIASSTQQSIETNEELISKARKELVTAMQSLSATFKATPENKGWESIPEVNRLMTTVDKLAPALDKLLDTIAARLDHPDGYTNAITYIHPMLNELGNVRKIMSELVSAQEDVNSLTAEQFAIFQNARNAIDNFVMPLLNKDSIVNKLSNKIPLDLDLLKPILEWARKWATTAVNLALGGAGLQSVNEQQDINNLFDVMLRQVITPGKVPPADLANKSYQDENIRKEIQLPERKSSQGETFIPWDGKPTALQAAAASKPVASSSMASTVDNSANSSSTSATALITKSSMWNSLTRDLMAVAIFADMVITGGSITKAISDPTQSAGKAQTSNNNTIVNNNNPPQPPAPKTLLDAIDALQASSTAPISPKDLVDRVIIPENLKTLSQLLDKLTSAEKQAADAIVHATIQLIVDIKEIQIEGFTKTTGKDVDTLVRDYETTIQGHIAKIADANRAGITASIKTIIDNINRKAILLDLLTLLQKSYNVGNCPQELTNLNAQISGASNRLEQIEDPVTAEKIEQEMIQFFINVTTIDIPGKTKSHATFSEAKADFTGKLAPLLSDLSPGERMLVCAIFCGVLCALAGAGILFAAVAVAEITVGMVAGSMIGGLAVGSATGSAIVYNTSSYKAITKTNPDVMTAAENSGVSRFTPQNG